MLSYISAKEAAEKWNISQRRVAILCAEERINGAMMVGNMWIIPSTAEKPIDKRTIRYEKQKVVEFERVYKGKKITAFYSDSLSDLPMMKVAGKGFLVEGEKVTELNLKDYN